MRRFWSLVISIVIGSIAICPIASSEPDKTSTAYPEHIITLAPSITETVFALGLGDQVIAVTKYCDYPPEVVNLPNVGGFIDPNIEAILALQPDLVILLANQQQTLKQLGQLNIATLAVRNTTLSEIREAIIAIGQATGNEEAAQLLLTDLDTRIARIAKKIAGKSRPRVMVTMGHSSGSDSINTVYIAGHHDFYNDLISLAGGENVYQSTRIQVPSLTIEGIMQLNPDVIIDLFPEADDHDSDLNTIKHQWRNLSHVNAVKQDRVHIVEQSYATIPGPRIALLLEHFARLIHPEINWND